MIIADRLHLLAIQAARRIDRLGMDPVVSIRRALIYATNGNACLPRWQALLTPKESETALALSGGPMALGDLARCLGTSNGTALARLLRLKDRGVARRARLGVWELAPNEDPKPRTTKTP